MIPEKLKHWAWHVATFAPQLWEWLAAACILGAYIWWKQPQQIPVIVYKGAQFCAAVFVAHLLDVMFFKVTDDEERDVVRAAKEIARAIVFLGTVLGLTLGM